jgi:hypothetical protein
MSTRRDANSSLRELEALLGGAPQGTLNPGVVGSKVREALRALSDQPAVWIGDAEAARLLGISSEETVRGWVQVGLLRGQTRADGCVQVRLDDVLSRRAETEGLMAIGGEEMTSDELRILSGERPGKNPWERE